MFAGTGVNTSPGRLCTAGAGSGDSQSTIVPGAGSATLHTRASTKGPASNDENVFTPTKSWLSLWPSLG